MGCKKNLRTIVGFEDEKMPKDERYGQLLQMRKWGSPRSSTKEQSPPNTLILARYDSLQVSDIQVCKKKFMSFQATKFW